MSASVKRTKVHFGAVSGLPLRRGGQDFGLVPVCAVLEPRIGLPIAGDYMAKVQH